MITRTISAMLLGLFCCIGLQVQGNSQEKPLKIVAIYPAGEEVNTFHRITIEFNQKVVALGASMFVDDVVPIDIEPALDCEWNWVKLDSLKCELLGSSDLNASTRYKVTVRPGIKTPHGQEMDEEYVHFFQTILPSITSSNLVSWVSPTRPIIEVSFNQVIDLDSLIDRLFLYDSVTGKEIPTIVQRSSLNDRNALQRDYFGRAKSYSRYSFYANVGSRTSGLKKNDVLVRPMNSLSPSADVSLLLLPGVEGVRGNLNSTERLLVDSDITTFNEFRLLGLACKDVSGKDIFLAVDESYEDACDVRSDIRMVFSSQFADGVIENVVHTQPPTNLSGWLTTGRGHRVPEYEGFGYSLSSEFRSSTTYRLYVAQNEEKNEESKDVKPVQDGFERNLVGSNQITFRTGPPTPRAYLNETNVVVDSRGMVDPQIVLGNVEDVRIEYDVLD